MWCKWNTNFIYNSRTFFPKNANIWEENQIQIINLNFCILQMQHMYVISWLQCSSLVGNFLVPLTEIRTEGMFDQSNWDDFRAYKENAMDFLALCSKHFPTWKPLQPQSAPKAGDVCAHTKVLMRTAWQDTISIWMLKTTQLCKAGLHQIREEHLKHFYLCILNWNFYFYLPLYLGQAQKNQAYVTCNVLY